MKEKLQFYINGDWVESDSSERIEVINPANEELVGHVTAGQQLISIKQFKQQTRPLKHIKILLRKIA
jgi:acyl-CoA reductase-like NAD-dependent aldehyde dehydrogenase